MIAAVLSLCLVATPSPCMTRQIRVEPAACHLRPYRGEAPIDGAWRAVILQVRCEGRVFQHHFS